MILNLQQLLLRVFESIKRLRNAAGLVVVRALGLKDGDIASRQVKSTPKRGPPFLYPFYTYFHHPIYTTLLLLKYQPQVREALNPSFY